MRSYKKRGALGGIVSGLQILLFAIILMGLIGIFGGFFGLMQSEVQTDLIDHPLETVINESTGGINATGYTLSNASVDGFASPTILIVWDTNATGNTDSYTAANFSVTSAGVLTNTTAMIFSGNGNGLGSNATVSYTHTYNVYPIEYYHMGNASEGQTKIFSKLGLTGTIIVFTFLMIIILGVVGYFMSRNYMGGNIAVQ